MKILVVHEVSYLKKIVYEFQILPETLSLLGHEVTVVDFDDTWKESPSKTLDLASKRVKGVSRVYQEGALALHHPGIIRLPILSRISGALTSAVEVLRTLRQSNFDIVLLYAVPTVGLQTLLAAWFYRVPLVFRSIDISHQLVPSRFLSFPTRVAERIVYRRADAVSVLTPRLKSYVASYGVSESRIQVQPAGVDIRVFSPGESNDTLMARWGVRPENRVLLFMGTIYRFSGLDSVIRNLPELLRKHSDVRVLIVGGGDDELRLRRLTEDQGVTDQVVFTGVLDYDLLPDIIRSSTVCLNPFELNDVTRDILPTKLFQYLACGKPLVATRLPGTVPFLSGEDHGVLYAELPDFMRRVASLLESPERCEQLGQNARRTMEASYDWHRIAESVESWMHDVIEVSEL